MISFIPLHRSLFLLQNRCVSCSQTFSLFFRHKKSGIFHLQWFEDFLSHKHGQWFSHYLLNGCAHYICRCSILPACPRCKYQWTCRNFFCHFLCAHRVITFQTRTCFLKHFCDCTSTHGLFLRIYQPGSHRQKIMHQYRPLRCIQFSVSLHFLVCKCRKDIRYRLVQIKHSSFHQNHCRHCCNRFCHGI